MIPAVVLFDLDDTLFAHSRAVATGVAAYRAAHGGALSAADDAVELARWYALEEHHYHRYLAGEVDYREQRRHRARGFVEPFGLDLVRIHWESFAGNYASAIVARRNGFHFEGIQRQAVVHRDRRVDTWNASLLRADDREIQPGWPL